MGIGSILTFLQPGWPYESYALCEEHQGLIWFDSLEEKTRETTIAAGGAWEPGYSYCVPVDHNLAGSSGFFEPCTASV